MMDLERLKSIPANCCPIDRILEEAVFLPMYALASDKALIEIAGTLKGCLHGQMAAKEMVRRLQESKFRLN